MINKTKAQTLTLLILIILVCTFLYYPALSGGYMLDDENSLSKLRIIDDDFSFKNLKAYLGMSKTGVLYRPIPVFSFLLDGSHWPTEAHPFKVTNLIIHLFNGALLFTLIFLIFSSSKSYRTQAKFLTFISLSLWMLHPFLVSTVMYIVQRMVLLSATFAILGLLSYFIGRKRYNILPDKISVLYMFVGMYVMTVLSVLSKENGMLLVFFIGIFESLICIRFLGFKGLPKKLKIFIIYLPVFVLAIVLVLKVPSFLESYNVRTYTFDERLFTQFRGVVTYLYHIFIPKYLTEGVYTDGFILSKDILNPLTTLISLTLILALLGLAWFIRKNKPLISFSIFFFFLAHILESTIVPLELYFEHRNYIPMLFIFIPLAVWLNWLVRKSRIFIILSLSIVLYFSFTTYLRANLWGDNFKLHYLTMQKYPESVRARILTIIEFQKKGDVKTVFKLLEEGIKQNNRLDLKINQLNLLCENNLLKHDYIEILYKSSLKTMLSRNDIVSYGHLVYSLLNDECVLIDKFESVKLLINILEYNSFETKSDRKPLTNFFKAKLSYSLKKYKEAKEYFIKSFMMNKDYSNLFLFIEDYINLGKTEMANELITIGLKNYKVDYKYSIDWFDFKNKFQQLNTMLEENNL
jgi:tetratricopeptide (TPR) repeat protein